MLYDGVQRLKVIPNLATPVLSVINGYMDVVKKDGREPLSSKYIYEQVKTKGLTAGIHSYIALCRFVANKNNLPNRMDIGTMAVSAIGIADTLTVVTTGDSKNQPLGNRFLKNNALSIGAQKTAADRFQEDIVEYSRKSANWFSSEKELSEAEADIRISGEAAIVEAIINDDSSGGW